MMGFTLHMFVGTPKGAMISHGNIVANVTGNAMVLCYLKVEPGDSMISYLPLAHMYERICQVCIPIRLS